jgi:hypothetical protein
MAQIGTRDPKLGNLIKYEEGTPIGYCRKEVVVNEAAAQEYTIGTLLGFDGTDWKISDPAAVDGSETIAAVVIENKSIAAATNTNVAVLYRGPASVADDALVLGGHTAADAAAALEALGIKVQTAV